MKSILTYSLIFCFCSLTLFVACQAQDHALDSADHALFDRAYNDKMAVEMRESHAAITDMIAFGRVDLESLVDYLGMEFHPCTVTEDVSWIKGSMEYLRHHCRYTDNREKMKEKYPELQDLPSEKRSEVFRGKLEVYTSEQVMEIYHSRKGPDR